MGIRPSCCSHKRRKRLSSLDLQLLTKITKFSGPELRTWHRGFTKDCPSGLMSRLDFISIYRQFFPNGNPEVFAGYIFDKFQHEDKFERIRNFENENHLSTSGIHHMSFEEFIISISVLSRGSHSEKLLWIFHILDNDNDGFISRSDVKNLESAFNPFSEYLNRLGSTRGSHYVDWDPKKWLF